MPCGRWQTRDKIYNLAVCIIYSTQGDEQKMIFMALVTRLEESKTLDAYRSRQCLHFKRYRSAWIVIVLCILTLESQSRIMAQMQIGALGCDG